MYHGTQVDVQSPPGLETTRASLLVGMDTERLVIILEKGRSIASRGHV